MLRHQMIDSIKGERKDRGYQAVLANLQREATIAESAEVGPVMVDEGLQENNHLYNGLTSLMSSLSEMMVWEEIDSTLLSFIRQNDVDGFVNSMSTIMGVCPSDVRQQHYSRRKRNIVQRSGLDQQSATSVSAVRHGLSCRQCRKTWYAECQWLCIG